MKMNVASVVIDALSRVPMAAVSASKWGDVSVKSDSAAQTNVT